jgi:CubicO group peptidase (beta-lactamase class C family)
VQRVKHIVREAAGKQFTGAVARIEQHGKLLYEAAFGATRADERARPVYVDTPFDLASITKIFVATLALRAVDEGKLALDQSVLPEGITLRMLLAHNSGMNSGADFRQLLGHNVVQYARERALVSAPGEKVIYSDLGFIALGDVLERTYGVALPALMRAVRSSPRYRPEETSRLDIPATEDDGWRGRVQGFVHDEKAFLMGGVAGHAGLFGSAADVAWIAEQYLAPLTGRGALGVISARIAQEAVREQAHDPVLRRGLGWALKTSDENSCGPSLSMETFGHTGFVGTCVWSDPQRDCTGVLLTNSVYFGRNDTRELRAAFYEAMAAELDAA